MGCSFYIVDIHQLYLLQQGVNKRDPNHDFKELIITELGTKLVYKKCNTLRGRSFHTNLPLQFITNGFNNVFKVIVKKKRVMVICLT